MKAILLTVFSFLILSAQWAAAQIPSVVNVDIKGQNYQLIELVAHNNRWYKHEPEYWTYKQLTDIYPLTIYKADYESNKALLKYLPDHRDFYTKHPHIQKLMFIANIGSLVLNVLQVVKI